eukprot:NODE_204_length_14945_cov_0.251313.p8 type:complete len:249 gc:universal NODE_204_length_14945_cov_0.251313:13924-14670(+)
MKATIFIQMMMGLPTIEPQIVGTASSADNNLKSDVQKLVEFINNVSGEAARMNRQTGYRAYEVPSNPTSHDFNRFHDLAVIYKFTNPSAASSNIDEIIKTDLTALNDMKNKVAKFNEIGLFLPAVFDNERAKIEFNPVTTDYRELIESKEKEIRNILEHHEGKSMERYPHEYSRLESFMKEYYREPAPLTPMRRVAKFFESVFPAHQAGTFSPSRNTEHSPPRSRGLTTPIRTRSRMVISSPTNKHPF